MNPVNVSVSRFALIRHLRPCLAPGLCYGRLDADAAPPAPSDQARFRAAMRGLRRPLLFASPARRCLSLARTFGGAVTADPRLLELDFGAWEGRRWEEIDRAALDAWAADPCGFTPPGGEPVAALVARVEAFARDLRALGRDAVIVTHGGPLRVLLPVLRRAAPDLLAPAPPFGSVTMIADQPAEAAAASSVSTAHSATCSAAPSTSPV